MKDTVCTYVILHVLASRDPVNSEPKSDQIYLHSLFSSKMNNFSLNCITKKHHVLLSSQGLDRGTTTNKQP